MGVPLPPPEHLDAIISRIADPGSGGVILRGPAGSGKSHLLRAVREALAAHPRLARRPVVTIRRDHPSLSASVATGTVVVADNLEQWSAVPLGELSDILEERSADLVGAVRTRSSERVLAALRGTRLVRVIEPEPWDMVHCAEYAELVLGSPLHPGSCHALVEFTGGNPLCLTELLVRGSPHLELRLGMWFWIGRPVVPPITAARTLSEVETLPDALQEFAATLAAAGRLPLVFTDEVGLDGLVAEGEQARLIVVTGSGAEAAVALAQQLEGHTILADLPRQRRRRTLLRTAAALADSRAAGPARWLSVAALYRRAGSEVPPILAERVDRAELTMGDPALVQRSGPSGDPADTVGVLWQDACSGHEPAAVQHRGTAMLARLADEAPGRARCVAAIVLCAIQAGRVEEAARMAAGATTLPGGGADPDGMLVQVLGIVAALVAGRITELDERAGQLVKTAQGRSWEALLGAGLALGGLGALAAGEAGIAHMRLSAAGVSLQEAGMEPAAAAAVCWCAVTGYLTARTDTLASDLEEPTKFELPWLVLVSGEFARGELALLRADRRAAAAIAAGMAEAARARANPLVELLALHLAARARPSAASAERLAALALKADFDLARQYARHAAAAQSADGLTLSELAQSYADAGLWLLAAETSAAALDLAAHGPHSAWVAPARKLLTASPLQSLTTPPWWGVPADRGEVLTPREREVAAAAARGLTSPAIAELLGLSTRTVDNHLSHVFRKLGVGSRAGIAGALPAVKPRPGTQRGHQR